MICYVLAMGKQHLGPHVVVVYGIKIFWPGLFITSPDHLGVIKQMIQKKMCIYETTSFPGSFILLPPGVSEERP